MKFQIAWSLLAVMVVGCGEVTPKESEMDGGPDGPVQAKPVKVRVTGMDPTGVYGTGVVDANAIVIFSGADNTVLQQGKVNAQGEAEAIVPEGSTVQTLQVLTLDTGTKRVFIMTFHDVKPGDVLNAGVPRSLPETYGSSTTMTGNFAVNQSYNHSFYYECGSLPSSGPAVTMTFYERCHGASLDFLAIQTSVATPTTMRYAVTKTNYQPGGMFEFSTNWQPMANFVATMTNLPDDITTLTFSRSTFLRAGVASPVAPQSVGLGDPPAGAAAASIPYAPGAGTRAAVTASLSKGARGTFANQQYEVQTADIGNSETIDYNELSVPWVSPMTYSAAERKLSWTETASGSGTPDVRVAAFAFRFVRDNTTYNVTSYDISRPSSTTSVVATALPAAYAEFDPTQQTTTNFLAGILAIVDQSNLNGYDDARQLGIGTIAAVGSTPLFPDQAYRRRVTLTAARQQ